MLVWQRGVEACAGPELAAAYDPPMAFSPDQRRALDAELSRRFIALDPAGYFLIRIDPEAGEIIAEHFDNTIDGRGRATDPATGEVLGCRGGGPRQATRTYRGRSAKDLGIQLSEGDGPWPLSRLDHALYLGRELQRAERCLEQRLPYVQD